MELDEAVRTFLSTKPDSGDPASPLAQGPDACPASPDEAALPLASPLRKPDFAGLPAAQIMTAQFDPLRRDGEFYAERPRAAGVAVDQRCYPDAAHFPSRT